MVEANETIGRKYNRFKYSNNFLELWSMQLKTDGSIFRNI